MVDGGTRIRRNAGALLLECGGIYKSHDQGMRRFWCRAGLRNEQRADKEWMVVKLHHSDCAIAITADDAKWAALQRSHVLGVDAKVAVVAFNCGCRPVESCHH